METRENAPLFDGGVVTSFRRMQEEVYEKYVCNVDKDNSTAVVEGLVKALEEVIKKTVENHEYKRAAATVFVATLAKLCDTASIEELLEDQQFLRTAATVVTYINAMKSNNYDLAASMALYLIMNDDLRTILRAVALCALDGGEIDVSSREKQLETMATSYGFMCGGFLVIMSTFTAMKFKS